MNGFVEEEPRQSCLWFELALTDFYAHWKGKLIVGWPGKELSWWRWAHRPKNIFPIHAILEESAFDPAMPGWSDIDLSWVELKALPAGWKSALREWRGIYYILDTSDGKGYVGSAYGEENLLGRWQNYAVSGHGGNTLLKQRDAKNFQFTILQRVSPDMEPEAVQSIERSWKRRLHTLTHGLNEN
jgi:hypothetical protein